MNKDLYQCFLNYRLLFSKPAITVSSISSTFTLFLAFATHLEAYLKVKSKALRMLPMLRVR